MLLYVARHLDGEFEELSCFRQLEDEGAAMYFQYRSRRESSQAVHH